MTSGGSLTLDIRLWSSIVATIQFTFISAIKAIGDSKNNITMIIKKEKKSITDNLLNTVSCFPSNAF